MQIYFKIDYFYFEIFFKMSELHIFYICILFVIIENEYANR